MGDMLNKLSNSSIFYHTLDSLSRYITIKTSPNGKVRFYSWDDLTGGSWHSINCVAQFVSTVGQVMVQRLSDGYEGLEGKFTDSKVYDINEININDTTG